MQCFDKNAAIYSSFDNIVRAKSAKTCEISKTQGGEVMFPFENLSDELKKSLSSRIPDFYRIVDVDTHAVFDYSQGELIQAEQKCYQIWNMSSPCVNCTSVRAVKEKKHIIKLSFLDNQIFLIHSIPITIKGREYSIELIQDVSDSFLLQRNSIQNVDEVVSLISLFNERIMQDTSTNLFNKQYLLESLPAMIKRAEQEKQPLSLAVLDIDHFKQVNDEYGHMFGDEVILKIAEEFLALMDDDIHCARIGGDEFAIIFEKTEQRNAVDVCRQTLASLASFHFELHPEYSISISYGIASLNDSDTVESLLDRADRMMYAMKHHNSQGQE